MYSAPVEVFIYTLQDCSVRVIAQVIRPLVLEEVVSRPWSKEEAASRLNSDNDSDVHQTG